jgi:hypothetical protein
MALQLLNEKSDENMELRAQLTEKDTLFFDREMEYQHQLTRRDEGYREEVRAAEAVANDFKQLYKQASKRCEDLGLELLELRGRYTTLEQRLKSGLAQLHAPYEARISELKRQLRETHVRTDMFRYQIEKTESLRTMAAEHPMLEDRAFQLKKDMDALEKERDFLKHRLLNSADSDMVQRLREELGRKTQMEDTLRVRVKEVRNNFKIKESEMALLGEQLTGVEMELDAMRKLLVSSQQDNSQASSVGSMDVIICRWAVNSKGDWCSKELHTREVG